MMQQFPSAVVDAARDTGQATPGASGSATPSLDLTTLTTQLNTLGFRPAHVSSALKALQTAAARLNSSSSATNDPLVLSLTILSPLEAAIEWLLLHLPEDDLPQRYRTTASSSDFVVGASRQGGLVKGWLQDKLVKQAGFPRKAVETILATDLSESAALEVLGRKLCGWHEEDDGWGAAAVVEWQGSDEEKDIRAMSREEEIMAVEAVLGERYRQVGATELAMDIHFEGDRDDLTLHVMLDESSPYPSVQYPARPPAFYLSSKTLPAYMRLHLQASLLRQFRDTERGDLRSILESGQGGAVLSMVEYLEGELPQVVANPPDIGSVTDHLIPKQAEVSTAAVVERKAVQKTKQVKRHREATEADHARAVEGQKRMRADGKYAEMMRVREGLPAWKERDNITNALESSRVLVVVGEVSVLSSCDVWT